jgi:hypothetical protein
MTMSSDRRSITSYTLDSYWMEDRKADGQKENGYIQIYAECGCMSDLGNKVSKVEMLMEGTTVPAG